MRFLIDECLHESLFFNDSPSQRPVGMAAQAEMIDMRRLIASSNRVDFLKLFGRMDLHPGLIVLVPNVVPLRGGYY